MERKKNNTALDYHETWHTGFNDYKNENVPCTHALSWIVTYIAMYIISIKTLIERQHLSIINFSYHTFQISSYYLKGFLANITVLKYNLLHIFRQVFFGLETRVIIKILMLTYFHWDQAKHFF